MPKINFNPEVMKSAQRWVQTVRKTLGRPDDSPDDTFFANQSTGAVYKAYGYISRKWANPQYFLPTACDLYQGSILSTLLEVQAQKLRGGNPKYGETGPYLDRIRTYWYMLPEDFQVRYNAELLAASLPLNKNKQATPVLESLYPGSNLKEKAVSALKMTWLSKTLDPDKGLNWDGTADAVIYAANNLKASEVVKGLGDLSIFEFVALSKNTHESFGFISLCQKTHEEMIYRGLWDKDNKNPDRAYEDGRPKPFNELSQPMKGNYVLIVLSYLAAKSYEDSKADKPHVVAA